MLTKNYRLFATVISKPGVMTHTLVPLRWSVFRLRKTKRETVVLHNMPLFLIMWLQEGFVIKNYVLRFPSQEGSVRKVHSITIAPVLILKREFGTVGNCQRHTVHPNTRARLGNMYDQLRPLDIYLCTYFRWGRVKYRRIFEGLRACRDFVHSMYFGFKH